MIWGENPQFYSFHHFFAIIFHQSKLETFNFFFTITEGSIASRYTCRPRDERRNFSNAGGYLAIIEVQWLRKFLLSFQYATKIVQEPSKVVIFSQLSCHTTIHVISSYQLAHSQLQRIVAAQFQRPFIQNKWANSVFLVTSFFFNLVFHFHGILRSYTKSNDREAQITGNNTSDLHALSMRTLSRFDHISSNSLFNLFPTIFIMKTIFKHSEVLSNLMYAS